MRIGLVTSVAANIVTQGTHTGGASRGASDAAQGDDGFAAMLGAMNARGDLGKSTQPVRPRDGDADAAPADGDKTTDASSRALTRLQAFRQSWSNDAQPALARGGDVGRAITGGKDAAKDSDPAQSADDGKPAKTTDTAVANPVLAQMVAAQQPAPAAATAATTAASAPPDNDNDDVTAPTTAAAAVAVDPTMVAAQALAAAATDKTAASMLANGSTAKPVKATDAKAASDDRKTQTQGSTAAALADTANAARVFTDKQTSSAHALPLHAGADTPKNGNQPGGGSSTGQQNNGNPPNANTTATPATPAAATPATMAAANTPAAAPTHAQQAAPQPDASAVAANTSITPTAATQTGGTAPAQPATQLQVSHPAAAAPDITSLAVNIATKSEAGARHFDIRLDPAELGRVDVRLTVDDAGKAQATLSVEKPQTLELLQKDSTHLERALKDAGLDLSQNGLNFSLKGQQQQAGNGGNGQSGFSPRGRTLAVQAIAAADTAATNLSLSGVATGDSRLDIRV